MSELNNLFFSLTPERVLEAVETLGIRSTGRCMALNSMENRVYEVELDLDPEEIEHLYQRFRVIKFYRPGRWSREQIQDEHDFLFELSAVDIPAVAPLKFSDGSTLAKTPEGIWYTIFPKVSGRNLDELSDDQLEQLGRLIARMHNVGATRKALHRVRLSPVTYGLENLAFLKDQSLLPAHLSDRYTQLVTQICEIVTPWFERYPVQRLHGDCHVGNVLWNRDRCFLVDFDDMLTGPCVQDLWLICPGRDSWSKQQQEKLLRGYRQMREFDSSSWCLVEPLRCLRMIHFSAWIGKRISDPSFSRVFMDYGSEKYWRDQLTALEEQFQIICGAEAWDTK